MYVSDRFLFLHLHKSGGTFINRAIQQHLPCKRLGYHLPYKHRPDGYDHLPVLGVVRNPYVFYVSFYHFQALSRKPNYVLRVFSDDGSHGFSKTVWNMCQMKNEHLDRLIEPGSS